MKTLKPLYSFTFSLLSLKAEWLIIILISVFVMGCGSPKENSLEKDSTAKLTKHGIKRVLLWEQRDYSECQEEYLLGVSVNKDFTDTVSHFLHMEGERRGIGTSFPEYDIKQEKQIFKKAHEVINNCKRSGNNGKEAGYIYISIYDSKGKIHVYKREIKVKYEYEELNELEKLLRDASVNFKNPYKEQNEKP